MKKKYMQPDTQVMKIELQHMIAVSTLGDTDITSGNLSREMEDNFFFDE